MLTCVFIYLHHLGFSDFKGENTAYTLTTCMHVQHDLRGPVVAKTKKRLDHVHYEIHGGEIVIQQHDFVHWRRLDLRPGFLQCDIAVLVRFQFLAHRGILLHLRVNVDLINFDPIYFA